MGPSSSTDAGSGRRGEPTLASGTVVAGRFEVVSRAGSGGMGTVFKVRDLTTGMLCALKVLRGEEGDAERFQREAEALAQVRHPHVVGYVAHGTTAEGDPYLAMDWLAGDSLKDFLSKRPLTPREAAHLGRAVASALAAAHAQGVIHRDLKPSNLVVSGVNGTSIGSVKVLDFGVARLRALDRDLTRTGQVIGTPGYMAPEQARGEKDVDERADLFALGCVLYRSIVGRPAFDGEDVLAVLTLLVLHHPPRIGDLVDGVPDALDDLVSRLLAKDRRDRPPSANAAAVELERIAALPDAAYAKRARGVSSGSVGSVAFQPAAGIVAVDPRSPSDGRSGAGTTLASAPPRSSGRLLAIGALATLLVGGGVAAAVFVASRGGEPTSKRAKTSSTPSARGAPDAPSSKSIDELAKDAAQRCATWGPVLARMRDAGGAFGLEAQRAPGGWETGQAVMAWATAARACTFDMSDLLPHSVDAIDTLKRDAGWGSSDARNPTQAFSGANGWVLLGLAATNAHATDVGLQERAAIARKFILPLQNPSGTFRFKSDSGADTEEDYSTMIATWALVESDWLEAVVPAKEARARGAAALRGYLTNRGGDPPVETVAGYEEQMAWILLRDRKLGGARPASDRELFEKVAKDLLARCANTSTTAGVTTCVNAGLSANSHLEPDPSGREYFRTFWLPWATLLSYELARDTSLGLSADTRASVEGVARWALVELANANPTVFTAVYQVAEYLFAVSSLNLPDVRVELRLDAAPEISPPSATPTNDPRFGVPTTPAPTRRPGSFDPFTMGGEPHHI